MAFDNAQEIAPWLARKYAILGQQADAASTNAGANTVNANANMIGKQASAGLDIANMRQVAPNAIAQRGLVGAQTKGVLIDNQKNTNLLPISEFMGRTADRTAYGMYGLPNLASPAPASGAVSPFHFGATGMFSDTPIGGAATSSLQPYDKPIQTGSLNTPGFAKGTSKVPGKGSGKVDTVPAKLAPGEAVLNKGAAEHIGRDVIDQLNDIGMQKMGMVAPNGKGKPPGAKKAMPKNAAGGYGDSGGMPAPQGFAVGTSDVQPVGKVAGKTEISEPKTFEGQGLIHALALHGISNLGLI